MKWIAVTLLALAVGCGPRITKSPKKEPANNVNGSTNGSTTGAPNGATNGVFNGQSGQTNTAPNGSPNGSTNNPNPNGLTNGDPNSFPNAATNGSTNNGNNTNPPADACDNDADLAIISDAGLRDTVSMCGLECFQNADISGCTSECVEDQAGLSSDCSDCFGELTACTTDNCLAQCLEDSAAPECIECQEEFCADDFESCSGIPVN